MRLKDPIPTDKEIGERLREARERAGLSRSQAAKLLGGHKFAIMQIESGAWPVSPQGIVAYCELYNIGYDWLLGQWCEQDLPDDLVQMVEKLPPIDRRKLLACLASYGQMF